MKIPSFQPAWRKLRGGLLPTVFTATALCAIATTPSRITPVNPNPGLVGVQANTTTYTAKEAVADSCFAGGPSGHAIFLPGIDPNRPGIVGVDDGFTYKFSPAGTFVENAMNGTATLSGHVESSQVAGYGWDLNINFTGLQNNGTSVFELKPECYAPTGTVDPSTWQHYASFTGTLNGTGNYAGAVVLIHWTMHEFQIGRNAGSGAAGKNVDPGGSGWFTWTVIQQPTNQAYPLLSSSQVGQMWYGDLNFNITPPGTPGIDLKKSADKTSISPGGVVTYTYTVTNTGGVTLTNIVVTDDNGTPNDPSDDVIVGTIASLDPGKSQDLTLMKAVNPIVSNQNECVNCNNAQMQAGTLTVTTLQSGDIQIMYTQSQAANDNRYGTGATPATGWKNGHKFNDLVGSDQAEFNITDGAGNVVLDFNVDYISQSSSFPSGYGSLGISGGEGKLNIGNKAWVLSATTSLSDSINMPQFKSGFLTNSPPETAPNSGISIPAGWDYDNSYTVVISKAAFGSNGFGGVTIPLVHNSPSKNSCFDRIAPNPCDNACVTNIATVTAVTPTGGSVNSKASAQVCFGPPPGGGCPVSFYQAHQDKIGFGFTKDTILNTVFTNAKTTVCKDYGDGNKHFHDALGWHGGTKLVDAFHGLMREAVAAVVNASNPAIQYGISKADVIAMVNDALATCNAATLTSLQNDLEAANTRGSTACTTGSTANCTTNGKPNQLKLTYTSGDCSTAVNSQPLGQKYNCSDIGSGPAGASPVRIIVSSSSTTPTATSQRFFDGSVNVNSQFTVNGSFGANTYFFIYNGSTLVETIQIHTSCSAPLVRTETFGALRLDDYSIQ